MVQKLKYLKLSHVPIVPLNIFEVFNFDLPTIIIAIANNTRACKFNFVDPMPLGEKFLKMLQTTALVVYQNFKFVREQNFDKQQGLGL